MGKIAGVIFGIAAVVFGLAALYKLAIALHDFGIVNILLIGSIGGLSVALGLVAIIASIFGIELSQEEKRWVTAS